MESEFANRGKARILMITAREFAREAFRGAFFEGQDILCEIDHVDLIALKAKKFHEEIERFHKFMVWRDFSTTILSTNMAYEPIRITKEYDLFIFQAQYHSDMIQLAAIKGWRMNCNIKILWIDEMWANVVPKLKSYVQVIKQFDHVAIGLKGTVKVLSDTIEKTCHWVPGAVDAFRFCPYPSPPARVVDIYAIGRLRKEVHCALVKYCSKKGLFHIYDTFRASMARVEDYGDHRELIAGIAKRSRYFLVAPAKMDASGETFGQIEIGFRYYEGAAAGAVLLGEVPNCDSFRTSFDWPDAVIETKIDGSDVWEALENLDAQPERLLEISRRNAAEGLLRHDWVYRWERILDIAGLRPSPELESRKKRLHKLAEQILGGR